MSITKGTEKLPRNFIPNEQKFKWDKSKIHKLLWLVEACKNTKGTASYENKRDASSGFVIHSSTTSNA